MLPTSFLTPPGGFSLFCLAACIVFPQIVPWLPKPMDGTPAG